MAINKKGGLGKGLGKGIDLLISNEYVTEAKKTNEPADKEKAAEQMVKIRLIEPAVSQPRENFDEDSLTELAESIKKYGVIQPIIVKRVEDHYQIIAGERRWRAAKQAGLREIPVVIKDYDEQQIAEIALIENLQREDLNPIEEAKAYQSLIDKYHLKQEEIAEKVFKSRSVITNALRLLKLDEKVQTMLMEGLITNGHAKAILGLEDREQQILVAQKIIDEQLSVRETEKYIKKLQENKNETAAAKPAFKNTALYENIENKMKARMGTRVQIKRKEENKGKIEIEYYSGEDLERIIDIMGINEGFTETMGNRS